MKKSELKDYIKEQIVDILSEATPEEVENQKELNKELEKTADLMSKMDMKEEEEDAPAGDKAVQAKASKQDKIIKDFKRISAQMKTHLEMFKDAEGEDAKKAAKQMLKNLTPEYQAAKKAYDKLKNVKV